MLTFPYAPCSSAKFVFNNPNVTEACGCGESWTTV
jgi:Fe-S cluster assembly iron-binding protein IscA